jgi:hypothetical protein
MATSVIMRFITKLDRYWGYALICLICFAVIVLAVSPSVINEVGCKWLGIKPASITQKENNQNKPINFSPSINMVHFEGKSENNTIYENDNKIEINSYFQSDKKDSFEIKNVSNRYFTNDTIVIVSGYKYSNCFFDRAKLIFDASHSFSFTNDTFNIKNLKFAFIGNFGKVLGELKDLYSDDNFKPLVDTIFNKIKQDAVSKTNY